MIRILGFERRYRADGTPDDWVQFTSPTAITETGAVAYSTWERVKSMRPREMDDNSLRSAHQGAMWRALEPAYNAWLAGQELPSTGTPLAAWPGVTPQQADALRAVGIKTVEDVAGFPIGTVAKVPLPNFRDLQRLAQEWLGAKPAAEQAQKIADLEAKLSAALEMLAERAEPEGDEAPKRRGRPPKVRDEVEAA